ncbi:hypothetical protein Moror_8656 [Moniliophthora roreri MCA 2997]|uniref:Uncharacterized protein n=1 Tax=Moniliophthora roreri (strain MCA 2997) TaxID=1381753 RepID=V2XAR6_MONRO|nr:hypothetical protein Moror_8656 [Moniliophthora roreri MCA 2997]
MSTVRWDCTHSHMLSSKAIAEGWDTFIFVKWTRYGGNLVVGLNTKRKDDPDATIDIVPCGIEDGGILRYRPVEDIAWNRNQDLDQPWEPGNFRLIDESGGYYGCADSPVINDHNSTCIIQPPHPSEPTHASKHVAWIVPPDYCNALNGNLDQDRVQKPENLIQLPSALVDDFKKNKFAIDVVRQNRLVTFPGISPETDILLRSYTFTLYSSNVPFLRTHFRLCLRLHCLAGDIFPEYEAQVDDRLESIDTSSGYGVHQAHEDPLDIALRQWLLSQAMSELDYAQN